MVFKAFLVFLVSTICKSFGMYVGPNTMMDRPIFVGFLTGLVLGDVTTGVLIGAQLELIFLGVVFVGNATSAEATTGTAIAVAFCILYGLSIEEAIAIGCTLSYVCLVMQSFEPVISEFLQQITDKFLLADNQKGFEISAWILGMLDTSFSCFFAFLAVAFGGELVQNLLASMPEFILTGIGVAGSMLPAVGIAVLASLLWDKKTAIYFVFGYFVVKYLGIDLIFLAIIAIFIAVTDLYKTLEFRKAGAQVETKTDEEEFFG